jgi:soluble lytic murein transglycosylase-like protein
MAASTLGAVPPAAAGDYTTSATALLSPPIQAIDSAGSVPRPLSALDADRYRQIFRLQERGDWYAADHLISRLDDIRLLGHILAQRYLHPTAYKSTYPELSDWLAKYADLPEARRIYFLAIARKPADAPPPAEPVARLARIGNPDGRTEPAIPSWQAGLVAWRAGRMAEAAAQFEKVAQAPHTSPWITAAGAYWAARSHLKAHRPEEVSQWLRTAAAFPRTFYGQLARRALGMDAGFDWTVRPLSRSAQRALLETRGGVRVLELLQIGEWELAEDEMHILLASEARMDLAPALLAVSQLAGLPSISMRLGTALEAKTDVTLDAALYPVPSWRPQDGFLVDPALLYALMRQESAFDPQAKSPAGAAGLMQLMPRTAESIAAVALTSSDNQALFDPEFNLTLAQRYVYDLLKNSNVKGDLLLLAIAYNAGPGNLAKWRAQAAYDQDPLLFVESIPSAETRQYIERVLTNLWIYQQRLSQDAPSLDALASGGWPMYSPPKLLASTAVADGAY